MGGERERETDRHRKREMLEGVVAGHLGVLGRLEMHQSVSRFRLYRCWIPLTFQILPCCCHSES